MDAANSMQQLKQELKQLIVEECDVDFDINDILDHEQLAGDECRLALDSLDTLAIALEVKTRYGVHIGSGHEARQVLSSVDSLAAHITGS